MSAISSFSTRTSSALLAEFLEPAGDDADLGNADCDAVGGGVRHGRVAGRHDGGQAADDDELANMAKQLAAVDGIDGAAFEQFAVALRKADLDEGLRPG